MEENKRIISKELLSEVLKLDIREIKYKEKHNYIRYGHWNSCVNNQNEDISGVVYLKINICELADNCKEWAYEDKGIEIIDRKTIHNSYYTIISNTNNIDFLNELIEFNDENPSKYSNSRYGAIFKACEWIYTKI